MQLTTKLLGGKVERANEREYGKAIIKAKSDELFFGLPQYNQLITRRIREMGVYSELHDHEISIDEIKRMNPKGIILSGGPNSVYEEGSFTIDPEIYNLGIPVLGICYGMQLTTKLLGGKVERANERE
ncbi:hypothetical protein BUE67_13245, partial [Corynebacterium diphtheriae]